MPNPKAASVRGSRNRRDASKRPEASKGGPDGGSKGGRSKGRRNFKARFDTGSTFDQIKTPAAATGNLQVSHTDCEIGTNNVHGNIHCSENKQIITVADSMAELELEPVKKLSSSSEEEEEESDSSDSSDSYDNVLVGDAELDAYTNKFKKRRNPDSDSDYEKGGGALGQEELNKLGKGREEKNHSEHMKKCLELLKDVICELCLVKGHTVTSCPFWTKVPKEVKQLPHPYSILCKGCQKISVDCNHPDYRRCAVMKHCVNCGERGDHWIKDCPVEEPWWLAEERLKESQRKKKKKIKD